MVVDQLAALAAQVALIQQQQQQVMSNAGGAPAIFCRLLGGYPVWLQGWVLCRQLPKAAAVLAGPPRTRAQKAAGDPTTAMEENEPKEIDLGVPQSSDPLLQALSSQSTALTALVAHLAGGGDGMQNLSTGGGGSLSLSRGVARNNHNHNHNDNDNDNDSDDDNDNDDADNDNDRRNTSTAKRMSVHQRVHWGGGAAPSQPLSSFFIF